MSISNLGEQLISAQNIKNNDINSYVWKRARGNDYEQEEVKLVDLSEDELNTCYKHCQSMLYNKNKTNPGRYVLLNIIRRQRMCCSAELFLRWLENSYKHDDNRGSMSRSKFMENVSTYLNENIGAYPADRSKINITEITSSCPSEFDSLDVETVMSACLNGLGVFNKKHMTLKFITDKLGLWFTQKEMNEFSEDAKKLGATSDNIKQYRIKLVKERCGIPNSVKISVKDNKYLNFQEFRALIQLRSKNYNLMTEAQLLVLRDKGLYVLEDEVRKHIDQWETISEQIEKVAEFKGFTLNK